MPTGTETFTDADGVTLVNHVGELGTWSRQNVFDPSYDPAIYGNKLIPEPTQPSTNYYRAAASVPSAGDWEIFVDFDGLAFCGLGCGNWTYDVEAVLLWGNVYTSSVYVSGIDPGYHEPGHVALISPRLKSHVPGSYRYGIAYISGLVSFFTEPLGGGARTYRMIQAWDSVDSIYVDVGMDAPLKYPSPTAPTKAALLVIDPTSAGTIDNLGLTPFSAPQSVTASTASASWIALDASYLEIPQTAVATEAAVANWVALAALCLDGLAHATWTALDAAPAMGVTVTGTAAKATWKGVSLGQSPTATVAKTSWVMRRGRVVICPDPVAPDWACTVGLAGAAISEPADPAVVGNAVGDPNPVVGSCEP